MAIDHFHPQTLAALLAQFRGTPQNEQSKRWLLLEAAHVVGQMRLLPHLRVHALMLHFAWMTRDWREVAGQVMRLMLVPLGHALGRLPIGNPGRSNVSAFQPMQVRPDIAHAIAMAPLFGGACFGNDPIISDCFSPIAVIRRLGLCATAPTAGSSGRASWLSSD